MKIIQIFPGKVWGGAEQYILDLGNALSARGHDIIYLARKNDAVNSHLDRDGISYRVLPFKWALHRNSINELAEILRDEKPDVVHVHDTMFVPMVILARKRAGFMTRIFMTRHDAHRTPVNILFRHLFRQLDGIIMISDLVRRSWHGANKWFPSEKIHVVLNSIPDYIPTAQAESLRKRYDIPASTPLIVFSGRIKDSKGCRDIVKALAMIPDHDFAMVFIGKSRSGNYTDKLMAIASDAGIDSRIHFYGFTDNARQLMRQADIGLAPSVCRDGCLLSNIEFMQHGVCVISTDNGGQSEYLRNGHNSIMIPPSDPVSLSRAIAYVLDDKELRSRLANEGKKDFDENMTYRKFVEKILNIYNDSPI